MQELLVRVEGGSVARGGRYRHQVEWHEWYQWREWRKDRQHGSGDEQLWQLQPGRRVQVLFVPLSGFVATRSGLETY